jgi:hypothetical protein
MRRTAGLLLALALTVAIAAAAIRDDPSTGPDPSLAAVTTPILTPDGPPTLQPLAEAGALQLDVPIRQERITAVVYHGIGDANTIPLQPIGRQLNAGFFSRLGERVFGGSSSSGPRYYVDDSGSGPDTGSVDIGAPAGTTVYSPVSGVVVSVRPFQLDGRAWGNVVQIRPDLAPAVTVTLTNLDASGNGVAIAVGDRIKSAQTALGTVIDLSKVLEQTVARYTSDEGNHVAMSIAPAAGASPIL